jgi:hypothetical protein
MNTILLIFIVLLIFALSEIVTTSRDKILKRLDDIFRLLEDRR